MSIDTAALELLTAMNRYNYECVMRFGKSVPVGSAKEVMLACGYIVCKIIEAHGLDSDESKSAQAKYHELAPFWTAVCDAKIALQTEVAKDQS